MLNTLAKKHPEFEYAAIVRSKEGKDKVIAQLPNVRVVIGNLNDEYVLAQIPVAVQRAN